MAQVILIKYEVALKQLSRSQGFVNQADAIAQRKFKPRRDALINKFINHRVTQEISEGPDASNTSNVLSGKLRNLFTFIGFRENFDPIQPLIERLRGIKLTKRGTAKASKRSIKINYLVNLPPTKSLISMTSLSWLPGQSWLKGIEDGIEGYGSYLSKAWARQSRNFKRARFDSAGNRSKGGIQLKKDIFSGGFKGTDYLISMLEKFKATFFKSNFKGL